MKLNLQKLPKVIYSNSRQFYPHEKHINRIFKEDVLILMYKGTLRFNENGKEVEVKEGQYYIQLANQKQLGTIESDTPFYYYIHFDGNFDEFGHLPLSGHFNKDSMQPLIEELINLSFTATEVEKQKCFFAVLCDLLNSYLANDTTEKIRLYIQNNYTKNISIKDLENLVFLSKNQIIKLFKKNYNMTPHKYIIELRLDNACDLLLSTDRTINIIASSVGFSDYSIFYKAFVNKFGVSPEEYRHLSNKSKSPIKGTNPPT